MEGACVWSTKDLKGGSEVGERLKELRELNAKMAKDLSACPIEIIDIPTTSPSNPLQPSHNPELAAEIAQNLKHSLNSLIFKLFGQAAAASAANSKSDASAVTEEEPLRVRWIEAFFPFTTPSYEVEVWWNGEWLEILGCGVVMQKTLETAGESI